MDNDTPIEYLTGTDYPELCDKCRDAPNIQ